MGLLCIAGLLMPFMASAGVLQNHSIDKTTVSGMDNVVGATTFSMADNDEVTTKSSLSIDEVYVYLPATSSIAMASSYTYKAPASFSKGGSETAPYYTVVSNPRDLGSDYQNITDGVNRLVCHAPKSQAKIFGFTTQHQAGKDIYVRMKVQQALNVFQKSKVEIWINGTFQKYHEFESSELSEYSFEFWVSDDAIKNAENLVIELRRGNYNEGTASVYAVSELYIESVNNSMLLEVTEANDSHRIGTAAELSLTIIDPALEGQPVTWQCSTNPDDVTPTWSDIPGTGTVNVVNPTQVGYFAYRAKIGSAYSNEVLILRKLACNGSAKIFFHEDFGTLASAQAKKSNAQVDAIGNYTPALTECPTNGSSVKDGMYAVVANPWYAGVDDGDACNQTNSDKHWFRNILDHTQGKQMAGEYGGMLLVNCKNPNEVIYENTQKLTCVGSYVNFSAWYANAGHARTSTSVHDINLLFKVVKNGATDVPNARIEVNATIDEGWVLGEVTFLVDEVADYTIQLINYGSGDAGNDVLVDDILFSQCIPTADLVADETYGTVTVDGASAKVMCGGQVKLDVASDQFGALYPDAVYYWCDSIPGSEKWLYNSSISGKTVTSNVFDVDGESWHKVLVVPDGALFDPQDYLDNGPDPSEDCPTMVGVTNDFQLLCGSVELILQSRDCNNVTLLARHDDGGSELVWEKSVDGDTWTTIPTPTPDSILTLTLEDVVQQVRVTIDGNSSSLLLLKKVLTVSPTDVELTVDGSEEVNVKFVAGADVIVTDFTWYRNGEVKETVSTTTYEISDMNDATYYVMADGCKSDDVKVTVKWPTIFTPLTVDGFNDTFVKDLLSGRLIALTVVDRYGNVVVKSDNGWDGKDAKGTFVMPGVYYYVATWDDAAETRKGSVEVASFVGNNK